MKAIVCEMCGSNEFKKVDGEYQCLHCKTRYTVEEAKKLFIEGTVDVKGTVQIDNSNNRKKYETLASRAYENEEYDQAYEYYTKLLEIDTDNWFYIFRKGICSSKKSNLVEFRVDDVVKSCKDALKTVEEKEENEIREIKYIMAKEINDIAIEFRRIAANNYNKYWELNSSAPEYWARVLKCAECDEYAYTLLDDYVKTEKREFDLYKTILKNLIYWYVEVCANRKYKSGSNQYGAVYKVISYRDTLRPPILAKYDKYVAFLKQYDPTYVAPKIARQGSGCYVATCVYGDYDCPEVWTLRRYRDTRLKSTWYGRTFVKIYYIVSPKIVKIFGKTKYFNKLFRKILDRKVNRLKQKGYESSYYED